MPAIQLADLSTHYTLTGNGTRTIVMVQGLGLEGAAWEPLVQHLAQQFKVLTFDARGAGAAHDQAPHFSTQDMATDLLRLCQVLQIHRPVLLGFSMGGCVAQHAAASAPDAVEALVLLSCVAKPSARSQELLAVWRDMVAAGVERSLVLRNQLLWASQASFYDQSGALQNTLDFVLGLPVQQAPSGFIRQADACIAHDGRAACALIRTPTLVLVGAQEQVFSVPQVQALAGAIAGAQYVCLPTGGHNVWLEYPDAVAVAVQAFIATLQAAA